MAYAATVYNVMIASPSDVTEERAIVREVLHEWNAANSKDKRMVLMPISWETDASPAMGGRPQEIINKQLLQDADLLIAAFWTRIGSPTGKSPSGTVEEIEGHLSAGKPAMLYFSSRPARPESIDPEQYKALSEFKKRCESRGLIESYGSSDEFRRKLVRQLAQTVGRYVGPALPPEPGAPVPSVGAPSAPSLSQEAQQLLLEASQDKLGLVRQATTYTGLPLFTDGKRFGDINDPRSLALWGDALESLRDAKLLEGTNDKKAFRVSTAGYSVADSLRAK